MVPVYFCLRGLYQESIPLALLSESEIHNRYKFMLLETEAETNADRYDDISEGPRASTALSVKDVLELPASPYTGSELTRALVQAQIAERWGNAEAQNYDPYSNAFTFAQWLKRGYRVIKGQRALHSVTYRIVKDATGEIVKRLPKTVHLFYIKQVQKM